MGGKTIFNSKPKPQLAIARTCLKCGQPFKSWGYGNRLCNRESCRAARNDIFHEINLRANP